MGKLLSSPEGIDLVTSHMDKALAQLESGEKKLRFRSVMSKEELRAELDKQRLSQALTRQPKPLRCRCQRRRQLFMAANRK